MSFHGWNSGLMYLQKFTHQFSFYKYRLQKYYLKMYTYHSHFTQLSALTLILWTCCWLYNQSLICRNMFQDICSQWMLKPA